LSTLRLNFEEQVPLQLALEAVRKAHGGDGTLERETGVLLHVRGQEVMLEGDEPALVERLLRQLYAMAQAGHPLDPSDVGRALEVLREEPAAELRTVFEDVVLRRAGREGRGVTPRSLGQKRYVAAIRSHALTFGVGPAGTGKTFLAVACAVHLLTEQKVRRIVVSRPAIEAGESLGFLPGTLEQKISPYLRPMYDALYDLLDPARVMKMVEQGTIELAPLAYMRGRTLNDSFVILDEAQNATREQMKMLLTRIGQGSKCVVTGDPSQIDLPGGKRSGLADALRIVRGLDGVAICRLGSRDVMRHPLVQAIVDAYDRDDKDKAHGPGAG
jgi:phosphate starvation-inducible PhoH-like protein